MTQQARGYIASGEFNGNRVPQHIQNQIVKFYCDSNGLEFVLSRAEYWIDGGTNCQLWAALNEGFANIVFFSLWQLPNDKAERLRVYNHCLENHLVLHFATESMRADCRVSFFEDLEMVIGSNLIMLEGVTSNSYLDTLPDLL